MFAKKALGFDLGRRLAVVGHEKEHSIVIRCNGVWKANQELVGIHNDAAHKELVKLHIHVFVTPIQNMFEINYSQYEILEKLVTWIFYAIPFIIIFNMTLYY